MQQPLKSRGNVQKKFSYATDPSACENITNTQLENCGYLVFKTFETASHVKL